MGNAQPTLERESSYPCLTPSIIYIHAAFSRSKSQLPYASIWWSKLIQDWLKLDINLHILQARDENSQTIGSKGYIKWWKEWLPKGHSGVFFSLQAFNKKISVSYKANCSSSASLSMTDEWITVWWPHGLVMQEVSLDVPTEPQWLQSRKLFCFTQGSENIFTISDYDCLGRHS